MKILKKCYFLPGISLVFLLSIFAFSCKNETLHPLPNAGDAPPGQVSGVRVVNVNGGAHIFYSAPPSPDFAYVLAEYKTNKGPASMQSSKYSDSITVMGFPDTSSAEVKLYSVSYGGARSAPVSVTVHPGEPSYLQVAKNLEVKATFGGITVNYRGNVNPGNKNVPNLSVNIFRDSAGTVTTLTREHIADSTGTFFLRGLEHKDYKIGFNITDQYQNQTDTVYGHFTPLFEVRLNVKKYKWANLALDWENTGRANVHKGSASNLFEMTSIGGDNTWFILKDCQYPFNMTIDLGQLAKVDRIVLHGTPQWGQYSNGYPKKYSIWGSVKPDMNSTTIDSSWFKYVTYTSVPPSGGALGTQAEINNNNFDTNGESVQLPDAESKPYVRYITFHWMSTYDNPDRWYMTAIEVYGQPKDPEANK